MAFGLGRFFDDARLGRAAGAVTRRLEEVEATFTRGRMGFPLEARFDTTAGRADAVTDFINGGLPPKVRDDIVGGVERDGSSYALEIDAARLVLPPHLAEFVQSGKLPPSPEEAV